MRQYQRLMRRHADMTYTDEEAEELRVLLTSAPGTDNVSVGERHPKGGYCVTFEIALESIESLITLLYSHGWVSVM